MSEHLSRALTFLRGAILFFWRAVKEAALFFWGRKRLSAVLIVVLIALGIGASFLFHGKTPGAEDNRRQVTLLSAADLSAPEPISLIGEVRSVSEASVAPEISGTVSAVYGNLGQEVSAGTVLAVLKNDSQRAAVQQAQAALAKAETGVTVSGIGLGTAQDSLSGAIENAKTQISSAYATIDDSVHKKSDGPFSNPDSATPYFAVATANSQAALNAQNNRIGIQPILSREASAQIPENADALIAELQTTLAEATQVRDFVSSVVIALNTAIPTGTVSSSAIAGYRSDASVALLQMNGLRNSISGAITALKAAQAGVKIGTENLSGGGSENPDIQSAKANLAAAQANLEKTIIRAPISGTINKLDIDVGSFVNASVPLVFITNAHGLEAVAYVSERDLPDIKVGAEVALGGTIKGKVTRISSALDPATKKAEIRISVPENAPVVSGSSASLLIARSVKTSANALPTLPLSALKLTPEGAVVFTVSSSTLVAHQVTLGSLEGSRVVITSGISPEMKIVEDARGLKEGQAVIVRTN